MEITQEIRNEHFMIGRDSNLGFRALGRLEDVNTACADVGECCVLAALTILTLMKTL